MEDLIRQELHDSATLKLHVAATQAPLIAAMIDVVWDSLQQGGTLLLCGNGGSAAENTQRIQEVHITLGHILCGELERRVQTIPLPARVS